MLFFLPHGESFALAAAKAGALYQPAWWLNLQAHPEATIDVPGRSLVVCARAAEADERERLWDRFVEQLHDYQLYAELAQREVPVVILEPTDGTTVRTTHA